MSPGVSWGRRLGVAVVVTVVLFVATSLLQLDPDPLALLLVVALVVAGVGLLGDAVTGRSVLWFPGSDHRPMARGRDGVTLAHARQIENHVASRRPDGELRDRLAGLADAALQTRHGVRLASPEGAARLGPDVAALLTGPVRRLSLPTIDLCLRTIEEL